MMYLYIIYFILKNILKFIIYKELKKRGINIFKIGGMIYDKMFHSSTRRK